MHEVYGRGIDMMSWEKKKEGKGKEVKGWEREKKP